MFGPLSKSRTHRHTRSRCYRSASNSGWSRNKGPNFLDEAQKHYQVEVRLGEESDTCDREGKIAVTGDPGILTPDEIEWCLKGFIGKSDQVPPHFSAIKKDGVPLYKLARRGIFPALEIRKIEVFELSILDWCPPNLKIDLICSKGAYARSLARDIGARLGVGGRVDTLRRIGSGKFNIQTAHDLEFIRNASIEDIQRSLIPLRQALEHIPEIKVSRAGLRKLAFGVYLESGTGEIISELELDCKANMIYRVQDTNDRIMILCTERTKRYRASSIQADQSLQPSFQYIS